MAATASVPEGPGCPEGTGGSTEPSPVAQIVIASPAITGFDGLTGWPPLRTAKIPGSCASNVTCNGALKALPFFTTRFTELTSSSSNGTCALIWVGET
jgi:hypothetical protein